jgi:hypothetical protein
MSNCDRSFALALALAFLSPLLMGSTGSKILSSPGGSLYDSRARQATIDQQRQRIQNRDPEDLRAAIDETHSLFSSLAIETRQHERSAVDEALKSLRDEHKLPRAERRARQALELAEEIASIQDGIRQQQEKMEKPGHALTDDADRDEARLLGLQSDLVGSVDKLRSNLRSLHKDLKEPQIRDLRNWAMVSEGLLRRRREAAQAELERQRSAEALPIAAPAGMAPPEAAQP